MLNKPETPEDPYARAVPRTPLRRMMEEFLLAQTLLTRIPAPKFELETQANHGSAFWAYPIIGALVGAIGAVGYAGALYVGLGAQVSVVIAMAAMVLATGAFHEDGFADYCDGVGGGLTRSKKLQIMRDSRLGTYGATALLFWFALTAILYAELATATWQPHLGGMAAVFICVSALQRACIGVPLLLLSPARDDGLTADSPPTSLGLVAIAFAIVTVACAVCFGVGTGLMVVALAIGASLLMTWNASKYLRGRTGDALGATATVAGIVALAALAAPAAA